jgi:hypothetical protein
MDTAEAVDRTNTRCTVDTEDIGMIGYIRNNIGYCRLKFGCSGYTAAP